MIFRPDAATGESLDRLTNDARLIAGDAHWATASAGSAHMTMRGLEPYRVPIGDDDPAVARYAQALTTAARNQGAVRFDLCGLLVTPTSVMLRATPGNETVTRMRPALDRALGDDGWYELNYQRDIWFLNLIHFAGPIARPAELVEWVEDRAGLTVGEIIVACTELVRWEFDGSRMAPVVLAVAPLTE